MLIILILICGTFRLVADDTLSRQEWIQFLVRDILSQVDEDADASISEEEARSHIFQKPARGLSRPHLELSFDQMDKDGDGKVMRWELQRALAVDKRVELIFDDYDIDNDLHLRSWEMKEAPTNVGIRFRF
ncbi:MAG: hypothetical protein HC904_17370 [Blastochloris sp.]|nr:hypothetical protein [Blastochloris sp.]